MKPTTFNKIINRVVLTTAAIGFIGLSAMTYPALVKAQWESPNCITDDCSTVVHKVNNPPKPRAKKITPKMPVEVAKQEKDYYTVCNTGHASRVETSKYVVYVCCMPGQECNAEDPKHRE